MILSPTARGGHATDGWLRRRRKIFVRAWILAGVSLSSLMHYSDVRAQYMVVDAFPSLTFSGPTDLQADGLGRLYVVQQSGVIRRFDNDTNTTQSTTFLNIADRVSTASQEEGLLGMAFHPNFAANGYFFAYYSAADPRRTILSRFSLSAANPDVGDPSSELVLLTISQPYENHNGGQLQFGPDGMLYIAVGDGGGVGDPDGNGQDPTTLLGSILRIDVDNPDPGINYGIPADNPFAGNATGIKEEIFAYGLRNPWRISFDGSTLWAGDVGQGLWEEVDTVFAGGNYGWNVMEGAHCFLTNPCDQTGLELPVYEYGHVDGNNSIVGGYVYRNARIPALIGRYMFADWRSGRIWALQESGGSYTSELLVDTSFLITTFGRDESGEVFVFSHLGKIYRLETTNAAPTFTSVPVTDAAEDTAYSYDVAASDAEDDPITLSVDSAPAWLSLTDNGDGTGLLTGTPGNDDVGVHSVTLRADDGFSGTTQSFDVTVTNTNDAPLIVSEPDTIAIVGQPYGYVVMADDVDIGDVLTFSTPSLAPWMVVGDTTSNTLQLSGTPQASDVGTETVVVRVEDVAGAFAEQTFDVEVLLINEPPTAEDDMFAVSEGGQLIVPASGVLGNDTDPDGDPITAALDTDVSHGTLDLRSDGGFDYQHDGSETSEDSFTYTATDGLASSAPATVLITVLPVNDAPEFQPPAPASVVQEDSVYSYNVAVTDAENDPITLSVDSAPAWLSLTDNGDGTGLLTGTPGNDDVGVHSVTLRADDGFSGTTQSFDVTVTNTNDAPLIVSAPVTITIVGQPYGYAVTADDVDIGDVLTFSTPSLASWMVVGDTTSNTLQLSGMPQASDVGTETVVVRVEDVAGAFAEQTFDVEVRLGNQPPTAEDDMFAVSEGGQLTVPASGVLANDTDPDGDPITAALDTDVSRGTLDLRSDGGFDYQHDGSETSEDSFTYTATDGSGSAAPATVLIAVSAVNDPPEFLPPPPPSSVVQGTLMSYVATVRDDDSEVTFRVDPLLPSWLGMTASGTNAVEISGTPDNSHSNETYTFDLVADDGEAMDTLPFSISVQDANDPPAAPAVLAPPSGTSVVLHESSSEPIQVRWSSVADPDGNTVTYTWQLARTESFTDMLMSVDNDTSTTLAIDAQTAYQMLISEGVQVGESLTLFHRAQSSDGLVVVNGPSSGLTLVRATDIANNEMPVARFALMPNHPNPFSAATNISFEVPATGLTRLIIFDALGREVARLIDGTTSAGVHTVTYVPAGVPSGLYVVRLEASSGTLTRVMTYIR